MVRAVVVVVAVVVASPVSIEYHKVTEGDNLGPSRGRPSLHFAFFEEDMALGPCMVDLEAAWGRIAEVVQETASTGNMREADAETQLCPGQSYPGRVVDCIRSVEAEVRFHTSLQVAALVGSQGLVQIAPAGRHNMLGMMEPVVTLRERNSGQALLISIPEKE
jgi:hypothetical protein